MEAKWLTLQEYSNRHKVSISTLRRKIKSRDIEYTFKNGRYLLRAEPEGSLSKESASLKELKNIYQSLIKDKDQQIRQLQIKIEDLNQLVLFLEQEKYQSTKTESEAAFDSSL